MTSPDVISNDILSDADKIRIKPYLNHFLNKKYAKKSIPWTGSKQDFRDYNQVLEDYNMDRLKRMILGGLLISTREERTILSICVLSTVVVTS